MSNEKVRYELKKVPLGRLVSKEFVIREALQPSTITVAGEARAKSAPVDEEGIKELAKSIEDVGLLQNMVVVPRDGGMYEVIAGNRRFRALKSLNLSRDYTVPVLVVSSKRVPRAKLLEIALTENLQRKKLSITELNETLIEILVERVSKIAIPDYPESINRDHIIKGLWYLNILLDPVVSVKPNVSQGFLNFIELLRTVLKEELDNLGISFMDYIVKIFPISADTELRESVVKGELDYNDAVVLSRIKNREKMTKELEEESKEDNTQTKVLKDVISEHVEVSEEEKEAIKEEDKRQFIKHFTQQDYDTKESVRKEAEKLGVKREELPEKKIINAVKKNKVKIEEIAGESINPDDVLKELLKNEADANTILIASEQISIEQIMSDYGMLPEVKKSIAFFNIIGRFEGQLTDSEKASMFIDKARVDALNEVMEFVKNMASLENDTLTDEEKKVKSEEIGFPDGVMMDVLGRFLEAYGRNLQKLAPKVQNVKRSIRGDAVRSDVLPVIATTISKMKEKEGEIA